MTTDVNPLEYITLKEAAQLMRLSRATLVRPRWITRLSAKKVGREWRVKRSVVISVLEGRR